MSRFPSGRRLGMMGAAPRRCSRRRHLIGIGTLTLLVALLLPAPALFAQGTIPRADLDVTGKTPADPRGIEAQSAEVQTIFELTNQDRAAQGLNALVWSPELAAAALAHARLMAGAARNGLAHRYPGEADLATRSSQDGARFSAVAENIAQGGNARQIEKQWMRSVPHQTNILDPRMNTLGIAVFPSGGTLYAVEDFAAASTQLSIEQVEHQVESELIAQGMPIALHDDWDSDGSRRKGEAKRNCPISAGVLEGSGARLVLRWEGSSLTLPQPLLDAVQRHLYTVASVGACPPISSGSRAFLAYRVAVLLY